VHIITVVINRSRDDGMKLQVLINYLKHAVVVSTYKVSHII